MASPVKVYRYSVDMTCEGCSGAVQRVLGKYQGAGVDSFDIDLTMKTVVVRTSLPPDQILDIIKKTGKTTSLLGEGN